MVMIAGTALYLVGGLLYIWRKKNRTVRDGVILLGLLALLVVAIAIVQTTVQF